MEVEFSKVDEGKQLHSMVLLAPHYYHFCFVFLSHSLGKPDISHSAFRQVYQKGFSGSGCNEMLGAPGCNERAVGGGKQSQQLAPPCHCIVQVLCVLLCVPCCAIISRQHWSVNSPSRLTHGHQKPQKLLFLSKYFLSHFDDWHISHSSKKQCKVVRDLLFWLLIFW